MTHYNYLLSGILIYILKKSTGCSACQKEETPMQKQL